MVTDQDAEGGGGLGPAGAAAAPRLGAEARMGRGACAVSCATASTHVAHWHAVMQRACLWVRVWVALSLCRCGSQWVVSSSCLCGALTVPPSAIVPVSVPPTLCPSSGARGLGGAPAPKPLLCPRGASLGPVLRCYMFVECSLVPDTVSVVLMCSRVYACLCQGL